ncbi:hypothetical protein [Nocardioides aquiterrae]|uniref:YiaAB two helix domain-containing protein n=1 Tax=Nocardioides aquiterrae TaxID=203799 RepID=A0ABN1UDG8_9ACTN
MKIQGRYEPSVGVWYAITGVCLFSVGGLMLLHSDGTGEALAAGGLAATAAGCYLVVTGAIARGMQIARLGARGSDESAAHLDEGGPGRQ